MADNGKLPAGTSTTYFLYLSPALKFYSRSLSRSLLSSQVSLSVTFDIDPTTITTINTEPKVIARNCVVVTAFTQTKYLSAPQHTTFLP